MGHLVRIYNVDKRLEMASLHNLRKVTSVRETPLQVAKRVTWCPGQSQPPPLQGELSSSAASETLSKLLGCPCSRPLAQTVLSRVANRQQWREPSPPPTRKYHSRAQ